MAVDIFTDGACSGNPGPGGFGAVLKFGDTIKEINGGEILTTNNRMELQACISALAALNKPCQVKLTTDSTYVKDGIQKWIVGWKKRGWKTAANKPVKNQDLWEQLVTLTSTHNVSWFWVKGHSGHLDHERADELARAGIPRR